MEGLHNKQGEMNIPALELTKCRGETFLAFDTLSWDFNEVPVEKNSTGNGFITKFLGQ